VPLERRAVAAGTDDLDVPPGKLCRLENRLAAATTGRADNATVSAGDGNPDDLAQSELVLGSAERALFSADAKPVTGVFHIGAGHHFALDGLHGAADLEARIWRIGPRGRLACEADQFLIRHLPVSKRLHRGGASGALVAFLSKRRLIEASKLAAVQAFAFELKQSERLDSDPQMLAD